MRVPIERQAPEPVAVDGVAYSEIPAPFPIARKPALNRKIAVRAALLAGILGLIISALIPFLGFVLTGALAFAFYRWFGGAALAAGLAARLGAAAATVNCAIFSFLLVATVVTSRAQTHDQLLQRMQATARAMGADLSPAEIEQTVRLVLSPPGLTLTILFYFVVTLALAAIGGAIAAQIGKPRR